MKTLSLQVAALGEATADLLAEASNGIPEPLYRDLRAEFYRICPPVLAFYQRLDAALEASKAKPAITHGGWAEEPWERRSRTWRKARVHDLTKVDELVD